MRLWDLLRDMWQATSCHIKVDRMLSDNWLVVCDGHFLPKENGDYKHKKQPLDAAVFLRVGSLAGESWSVAIVSGSLDGQLLSLRQLMASVDADVFSLLSRAAQLEHWWLHHQYCGRCGGATRQHATDLALECANCAALFYPRISPCVIGLVVDGPRCLLAKHVRSKGQRYSCLAGFIEVGESAEQAFVREVREEVGIEIANLRYLTSQNWPYPSQLMLGYIADYAGGDIVVDGVEIEHADWFTASDSPELPPEGSISRYLIDDFFRSQCRI